MTPARKAALVQAFRYWGASCAITFGFLFYKTSAPFKPVLIAGAITFALTIGRALIKKEPHNY